MTENKPNPNLEFGQFKLKNGTPGLLSPKFMSSNSYKISRYHKLWSTTTSCTYVCACVCSYAATECEWLARSFSSPYFEFLAHRPRALAHQFYLQINEGAYPFHFFHRFLPFSDCSQPPCYYTLYSMIGVRLWAQLYAPP